MHPPLLRDVKQTEEESSSGSSNLNITSNNVSNQKNENKSKPKEKEIGREKHEERRGEEKKENNKKKSKLKKAKRKCLFIQFKFHLGKTNRDLSAPLTVRVIHLQIDYITAGSAAVLQRDSSG